MTTSTNNICAYHEFEFISPEREICFYCSLTRAEVAALDSDSADSDS